MEEGILCKTKWERVGYLNPEVAGGEKSANEETLFTFRRIYRLPEIREESKAKILNDSFNRLIECEPYNHRGETCNLCEYRKCRGKVNLFEEDKDWPRDYSI